MRDARSQRLTPTDLRGLRLLVRAAPLLPGRFGQELFAPRSHRKPQAYARPGGRVLRRLEAHGLAVQDFTRGQLLWRPTHKGAQTAHLSDREALGPVEVRR